MPYPSYADALWLGFYPFAYAGLVLLARSRVQRQQASVWFDGLVGGLTAAAVLVQTVLTAVLQLTGGSLREVATNLAYPVADLLLLVLLVGVLALLGWRPGGAWWALLAGVVLFIASDTAYLLLSAHDTYVDGGLTDAGWPLALVCLAGAAVRPAPAPRLVQPGGVGALFVPAACATLSLLLLWWGSRDSVDPVAGVLYLAAVLVAVARTLLTFRAVGALAQSRAEARTDDLTGLANRRRFSEAVERRAAQPGTAPWALMLIDLDRFKEVNDSLGHAIGDQLLVLVAERLRSGARGGDVLARLGGDEFAVLLADGDAAAGLACGERIRAALTAPFALDGIAVHVDASIGVAAAPEHGQDGSTLLQRADVAMYAAKSTRGGVRAYEGALDRNTRERLELVTELRTAVTDGQLFLHYQPKVDLTSGRVIGVEALCRWLHPERGLVPPDEFIPLAEDSGLMRELTELVLAQALRQSGEWAGRGLVLPVAVNLSPSNLLDASLPQRVAALLDQHGLAPEALEVEVTETILLLDHARAMQVLLQLRALGVRLAVDDYGTGYSSLAYLKDLPVHDLKLDRSFVLGMDSDPLAAAIVRSTVGLAHTLGLRIIAEGVENEDVLETLRGYGCDQAQGFHISRPMPADALEAWVRAHEAAPSLT